MEIIYYKMHLNYQNINLKNINNLGTQRQSKLYIKNLIQITKMF